MMVLDTNVISEILKLTPSNVVLQWLDAQIEHTTFITVVTQAEILYGIDLLPAGSRRTALYDSAERMFRGKFEGRVLSFGESAARAYASIVAAKRRIGRPMSQFDGMIAAIARVNGASVATRNIPDFDHCGIPLINPWTHALQ